LFFKVGVGCLSPKLLRREETAIRQSRAPVCKNEYIEVSLKDKGQKCGGVGVCGKGGAGPSRIAVSVKIQKA
jgi:hypothetical protein